MHSFVWTNLWFGRPLDPVLVRPITSHRSSCVCVCVFGIDPQRFRQDHSAGFGIDPQRFRQDHSAGIDSRRLRRRYCQRSGSGSIQDGSIKLSKSTSSEANTGRCSNRCSSYRFLPCLHRTEELLRGLGRINRKVSAMEPPWKGPVMALKKEL